MAAWTKAAAGAVIISGQLEVFKSKMCLGFIFFFLLLSSCCQWGNGGLGRGSVLARSELTKETGKLGPRAAEPLPSLESALFLSPISR